MNGKKAAVLAALSIASIGLLTACAYGSRGYYSVDDLEESGYLDTEDETSDIEGVQDFFSEVGSNN